jgi:hypothetical protein
MVTLMKGGQRSNGHDDWRLNSLGQRQRQIKDTAIIVQVPPCATAAS